MFLQVFSIYDQASGLYSQPSVLGSRGVALRSFTDQINEPSNTMSKHPEDYSLYYLCDFNDETGEFSNVGNLERIVLGSDCVRQA